ncbi:hypothetical protein ACFQ07_31355 [Actinomadura adrarensis]|uniref:M48 family metalloprotease n=1 Tax=Actinomadura adrarensis TaxID=1819600 RepID=A0ABW3CT92_9ACTN
MSDTQSGTAKKSPPPRQRLREIEDFDEAMQALNAQARNVHAYLVLVLPVVLVLVGAGVAALVRWLAAPTAAAVITVALGGAVLLLGVRAERFAYGFGQLPRLDWDSARDYQGRLFEQLSEESGSALDSGLDRIYAGRRTVPVYAWKAPVKDKHARVCTINRGGCSCWRRRVGGFVVAGRGRTLVVVGDRLVSDPAALRFVLAHESRHVKGLSLLLQRALGVPLRFAWLALGLAVAGAYLLGVTLAVLGASIVLRWADELVADVAAARHSRSGDGLAYWSMVKRARPPRAWWTALLVSVLTPTHPPIWLRAWLAARVQPQT